MARPKTTHKPQRPGAKCHQKRAVAARREEEEEEEEEEGGSRTILLTLENNKRYAHTATGHYRISMASLQPYNRRLPHCVCNTINEERRQRLIGEERVTVIVEHDLNEYVLCVLETNKVNQCKLNLEVHPGEQIAFRVIGKTPVLLTGLGNP